MLKKTVFAVIAVAALAACETVPVSAPPPGSEQAAPVRASAPTLSAQQSARSFASVVRTMEPIAERECRARTSGVNCDFKIVVDDRPDQPANAFQTLDRNGRPIVAFTLALIADARNEDELAFVLGHETAHHIAGHIERTQQNAVVGAVLSAGLATLSGGDASTVRNAQRIGAQVGARRFSKEFELEADALGTIITARAGYDPIRGAEFFRRIPDPGNRFLGTHPPNAARIEIVRRTAASL